MKRTSGYQFFLTLVFISCNQPVDIRDILVAEAATLPSGTQTELQQNCNFPNRKIVEVSVNKSGTTIQTRFNPPAGFERRPFEKKSFANYLRNLPLKPYGEKVKYFDGEIKEDYVYEAVVDMEISDKNLQQCADAIIRLRGEYFYSIKAYDSISFKLTNGFKVDYSEWMKGNRVMVNGNKTSWRKTADPSNTYKDFRNYMEFVFTYAGTISLARSLHSKEIKEITAGDIFIYGGSPGHAVIVVDVAQNKTGEKLFMIAQSYMPAQETQILKNTNDTILNPWYAVNTDGSLYSPQWIFEPGYLKTW